MDSGASQIAAVSQAPAQPIDANSGICRPSRKGKFGGRTVVGNFLKQRQALQLHLQKGQERKEAEKGQERKEAEKGQERKEAGMRRPSVASRKKEDKAKNFWLFLVSLKHDLFFKNEEASILHHRQFLMDVFGRRAIELTIISSYYEYINAFVVKLTTKESETLQKQKEVEYVKDLNILVGVIESKAAQYAHLLPPFAPSSPKPPHLVDNMDLDSDVNRRPGNVENCKTKMVTTDDKPLPLPGTKLFLVGLNTVPLYDKDEEDLNDREDEILDNILDVDKACLVYHKEFLKKAFGSLASGLTVVRSYSNYGLNAFVVEVIDTKAEKWHGRFKRLAEVEYVREVKKREERSNSAISTSALPMPLSVEL